jgi:hypothetical protein
MGSLSAKAGRALAQIAAKIKNLNDFVRVMRASRDRGVRPAYTRTAAAASKPEKMGTFLFIHLFFIIFSPLF